MQAQRAYDAVRRSTRKVVERAKSVRLCDARLASFAATLDESQLRAAYQWDGGGRFQGDANAAIDYVFTVDAINFGSGYLPLWKTEPTASTYKPVASALKQRVESGGRCDASFAASATAQAIGAMLGMPHGFALADLYALSLNQLGRWVLDRFGSYAGLLASLSSERRGAALIELLSANVPSFDDRAAYDGLDVCFFKRAQILVSDLHLALGARGPGFFDDVAELTMFADNLVAHVLRLEGVLQFEPALARSIERGEILEAGCAEEVEIRASAVQAVERICEVLRDGRGLDVFPAMLDVYLWNRGQDVRYKSTPRHLCRTMFY